jgi:hypothetical protein
VRARWRALVALPLLLSAGGCAVGEFIAGAPGDRDRAVPSGLLARRCAGCHAAPDPGVMSADRWRESLVRMRRRIQLPEAEWDSLARMGSRGAPAPAPASTPAAR